MSEVGRRPAGFRLPPDIRLGRVRLQVADLERSLAFYRDTVGFALLALHEGGHAELGTRSEADDHGGTVLLELVEKPGVRPVPRRGLLGLYHFALLLPARADLGRFMRDQLGRGTPFGSADHAFSEALYLVDPDGITMEVYADRPRGEWQVTDGQYAAVSEALDGEALLAAGSVGDWGGVPPGAVLGHVHLYVGDLEAAARFYHDGLGFDKVIWSYPGALFVSAGAYHHHVGLNTWAAGAPVAAEDDARMLDWELVLDDATRDAAVASLVDAGFPVARAAGSDDVVAGDPWGIRVRLTTQRGR